MADLRVVPAALAVCVVLTGVSYAADKITLACSGTSWTKGNNIHMQAAPSQSFVMDPDRGIVTSPLFGKLSILKSTEDVISFKGVAENGDIIVGRFDRYSGFATVRTWHNKELVLNYDLNCKRANPLF
jgi:hypothetical protein